MNMREQFVATTNELIQNDSRVALLLGGISVAAFEDNIEKFPNRVFNAGISEQGIVSAASGMAVTGMIPIIHTIAPFVVERAYEQLKLDFGYQKQRGNFITTGASLDYSSFGATHQCPADISVLKQIPGMQIVVPGTADEFDVLYRSEYDNDSPTYFRLSRDVNKESRDVAFGKANVIKKGSLATIIAVGPLLDMVLDAVGDKDVTILYYTTLTPFDSETLYANSESGNVLICTPFYVNALLGDVINSLKDRKLCIKEVGMPIEFAKHYGYTRDHYRDMGVTAENIRTTVESFSL